MQITISRLRNHALRYFRRRHGRRSEILVGDRSIVSDSGDEMRTREHTLLVCKCHLAVSILASIRYTSLLVLLFVDSGEVERDFGTENL